MSGEISKKSFEYKVSKKVSELIQVVHMLFMKNHERELELEVTKEAYEQEIDNVILDARNKLSKIQQALVDEKRKAELRARKLELEANSREKELHEKYKQACDKFKESDKSLSSLRFEKNDLQSRYQRVQIENQRLQQKLAQSQGQVNDGSIPDESVSEQTELAVKLANCQAELEKRLANEEYLTQQLEHQKVHFETLIEGLKKDLGRAKLSVRNDADILRHRLAETTRSKERLEQKNRELEADLKQMKTEMTMSSLESPGRRRSVMSTHSDNNSTGGDSQRGAVSSRQQQSQQQEMLIAEKEELDRLRREIQWYRMELSNREGNFNRMFTDSAPIRVASRVGGNLAVTRNNHRNRNDVQLSSPRKQINSLSHDPRLTRTRAGHERLPSLGMRASTWMDTGYR